MKDKCVLCWCDTEYEKDTPIELRKRYVEGAGQLCKKCYNETYGIEEKVPVIESGDYLYGKTKI